MDDAYNDEFVPDGPYLASPPFCGGRYVLCLVRTPWGYDPRYTFTIGAVLSLN